MEEEGSDSWLSEEYWRESERNGVAQILKPQHMDTKFCTDLHYITRTSNLFFLLFIYFFNYLNSLEFQEY